MSSSYTYFTKYVSNQIISFFSVTDSYSFLFIKLFLVIAEDQTPRFLDVPHDTEILAGEPVRFQCRVEGEPFPIVVFYRVRHRYIFIGTWILK